MNRIAGWVGLFGQRSAAMPCLIELQKDWQDVLLQQVDAAAISYPMPIMLCILHETRSLSFEVSVYFLDIARFGRKSGCVFESSPAQGLFPLCHFVLCESACFSSGYTSALVAPLLHSLNFWHCQTRFSRVDCHVKMLRTKPMTQGLLIV